MGIGGFQKRLKGHLRSHYPQEWRHAPNCSLPIQAPTCDTETLKGWDQIALGRACRRSFAAYYGSPRNPATPRMGGGRSGRAELSKERIELLVALRDPFNQRFTDRIVKRL